MEGSPSASESTAGAGLGDGSGGTISLMKNAVSAKSMSAHRGSSKGVGRKHDQEFRKDQLQRMEAIGLLSDSWPRALREQER